MQLASTSEIQVNSEPRTLLQISSFLAFPMTGDLDT